MSVDVRTRVDGEHPPPSPDAFFDEQLPAALAAAADRIGRAVSSLPLVPLEVAVGDRVWMLAVDGDRAVVDRSLGTAGNARLVLDDEQVGDLATDQVAPMGWFASGALRVDGAGLDEVLDWWLVIRAALDGTTPHLPGDVELLDGAGAPLDLARSFTLDDDPAEVGDFLRSAGFVHLRGVFDPAEMAAVSADMDRIAPEYRQGDGRSWWATLEDGADALVRMQGFDERSETVAGLVADDRLQRLAGLTGDGHVWGTRSDNRIEALFKPLGVARGISDIPWHKDCSLGRHSYECCSFTIGISVTGADDTSGQLRVVAGSHRALVWPAPRRQAGLDLPVVDLATETGDLTVHLSCTLHMAQAPTVRPRRVMYTSMSLPPLERAGHSDGDAAASVAAQRARIGRVREAAPLTVTQ